MNSRSVRTEREYRRLLKEIEALMDATANTPAGDRLNVLVTLVEAWEAKHYPLPSPRPVRTSRG
jgi:HTH-type transcriptional regulator/antitoxin HigA